MNCKSHIPLYLVCLLFLLLLIYSSQAYAQTPQEYYNLGIELKKQNKIDEAIDSFRKAIDSDRKFAEAYFELALLYQSKGSPSLLKRAEDTLLVAKRNGLDELLYLNTIATIYRDRGFGDRAQSTWEKILDLESDNIDALSSLAKYHAEQVSIFRSRVDYDLRELENILELSLIRDGIAGLSIWYPRLWDENFLEYVRNSIGANVIPGDLSNIQNQINEITWDKFINHEDSLAKNYNKKILSIEPDNRDALYRLGLLFFDGGNFSDFAFQFEELVIESPNDKDGNLMLGLAYHNLHDYDEAFYQYVTARNLMTEDERAVFANVGYLKVGGLEEKNLLTAESVEPKFWTKRDPLYLTQYNERQLEHYSRVAEANLRYSVPSDGIEGWRTDRGKILIKYGKPNDNKIFFDNNLIPNVDVRIAGTEPEFDLLWQKYDFWYYDDFSFMFETQYSDDENKYRLGNMVGLNFREISSEVEKEHPERYVYEPKGLFIDFSYDYATFRGEDGLTRLEVYYGIPFNKIRFSLEDDYYYGTVRTGIFLHDYEWERKLEDIQDKDLQFAASGIDTSSDGIAADLYVYDVQPENYFLAIEMQDLYSDNVGTYRDTVFAEKYGYETLEISDIQLAWDISVINPSETITRENLLIMPNPRRFYRMDQPIFIYYEIYNLFLDGFPGNTDYTVEYSIDFIGEEKVTITNFVRNLLVNTKQEGVTTSFNFKANEKDESQFLRIDHSLTQPGPYQLTLKITDNGAQTSIEKHTVLKLFENN